MEKQDTIRSQELSELCESIRGLASCREYSRCIAMICQAMQDYPSAPQPHNLLGVILEATGNHPAAMKHFRAARALDPTYCPPSQNLARYGTFSSAGTTAFDECDCQETLTASEEIRYDPNGIKQIIRREPV